MLIRLIDELRFQERARCLASLRFHHSFQRGDAKTQRRNVQTKNPNSRQFPSRLKEIIWRKCGILKYCRGWQNELLSRNYDTTGSGPQSNRPKVMIISGTLSGTVTKISGSTFQEFSVGRAVTGSWKYVSPVSDETLAESRIQVNVGATTVAVAPMAILAVDANGLPRQLSASGDPDVAFENGILTVFKQGSRDEVDSLSARVAFQKTPVPAPPSNPTKLPPTGGLPPG